MSGSPRRSMRGGFVLIEVVVAVTLLMIVLPALGALTFQIAGRSIRAQALTHRTAVVRQLIGRLGVLPFDSLESAAGCGVEDDPPFPQEWCVTVDDLAVNDREVVLVITSTLVATRPDTIYLRRTRGITNPFDTR